MPNHETPAEIPARRRGPAPLGQAAAAGPFGQLRGLCEPGKSVLLTAPTVVEGIVVSDYRSPNMELNPNLNYYSVDLEENDRTVYVEAADGS